MDPVEGRDHVVGIQIVGDHDLTTGVHLSQIGGHLGPTGHDPDVSRGVSLGEPLSTRTSDVSGSAENEK
ncbi:hypothetical protein GCM10009632_02180 [Mycolicibacterium alvei]|uniref:Uncharacterized protein n=1 Tax=Mycolicibacterium alvei TaxID=67081 RepID=A0A6N4UVI5_9MYCO|nr:hypothetical protein MALV_28020 [Mycolicibacterium alvei]